MPISCICPSCSAQFNVKDEYAGKRAKCPKCREPITIPSAFQAGDTVKMPPPAGKTTSRPVAKPIPVDDEAEEAPRPKRRRDDDEETDEKPKSKRPRDEEEEDAPKSKRRRDEDEDAPKKRRGEDDDDQPRSKRRRDDDDDDKPKKKSKALVIILSIVGGIVLVCGGTCGGIWWFVIRPAGQAFASFASEVEQKQAARDSFKDNFQKVKAGMTKKEVDDLLGPTSAKALEHDISRVTISLSDWPKADDRWKPKAKLGHVLLWDKSGDGVLVAFSADPNAGGTVVGVVGNFGLTATEPVRLPEAGNATPSAAQSIVITADALVREFDANPSAAEAKYRGKDLKVTGVVSDIPKDKEAVWFTMQGLNPPAIKASIVVPVDVQFGKWGPIKKMKVGDTVTVTCKFNTFAKGKGNTWELKLNDALVVPK